MRRVESIFELMQINLPVPDHSTVSRRLGRLQIQLPVQKKESARHLVVDSTGVKVYGEGEWKTRQHGIAKRNSAFAQTAARRLESFAFVWRKLHLGIDETQRERADRRRGHFVSRFPRVQSTRPYGADAKRRETLMRSIARLRKLCFLRGNNQCCSDNK